MFTIAISRNIVAAMSITVLALTILVAPQGTAYAFGPQSNTMNRSQLQTRLQTLQQQLSQIHAAIQGGTKPGQAIHSVMGTSTPHVCAALGNYQLNRGSQGPAVVALQDSLKSSGYFTGSSTGYFGTMTEQALQHFQSAQGIVSSGNPATTGFGSFGPRTRAALMNHCSNVYNTTVATPITLSCSAHPYDTASSSVYGVGWEATASGGTGNYAYHWNLPGTSFVNDSLGGINSYSVQVQYNTPGLKQASIYVNDGSATALASCTVHVGTSTEFAVGCLNGTTTEPVGYTTNTLVQADGTMTTITDAQYICKANGTWGTIGSYPAPTQTMSASTDSFNVEAALQQVVSEMNDILGSTFVN